MTRACFLASFLVLAACSDSSSTPDPADRQHMFGTDARPVGIEVPKPLTSGAAGYPLVMVLHGYSANGFAQEAFFESTTWSDKAFILAPNGLVDSSGNQYWNADPQCCDFDNTHVDDSGYLSKIITDVLGVWPEIDPGRVYIMGHSNGGYMAYRMACDHADLISGIVSLAGDASSTPATCTPTAPVSVLHLHGTADQMVPFAGAMASTEEWAGKDACPTPTTRTPGAAPMDVDATVAGDETTTATIDGCPSGITIEQWTLTGSGHIPNFQPTVGVTLLSWLDAHHRP